MFADSLSFEQVRDLLSVPARAMFDTVNMPVEEWTKIAKPLQDASGQWWEPMLANPGHYRRRTAEEAAAAAKALRHKLMTLQPPTPKQQGQAALAEQPRRVFKARSSVITDIVFAHFDVLKADILGPCRLKRFVYPRQVSMYLLRILLRLSLPEIGRIMHRDHTTVMHAVRKIIEAQTDEVKELQAQCVAAIEAQRARMHGNANG